MYRKSSQNASSYDTSNRPADAEYLHCQAGSNGDAENREHTNQPRHTIISIPCHNYGQEPAPGTPSISGAKQIQRVIQVRQFIGKSIEMRGKPQNHSGYEG